MAEEKRTGVWVFVRLDVGSRPDSILVRSRQGWRRMRRGRGDWMGVRVVRCGCREGGVG